MLSGDHHPCVTAAVEDEGARLSSASEGKEGGDEGLASKLEFLLASMRVASLNLKSWSSEIDMIGIALKRGLVTVETACDWLDEMGVLRWLPPGELIETQAD